MLLLPAGIGLMTTAWLIHGALLERMSREFLESRLQDEAAFLEHQIRQSEGKIDALQTGDYFQEVFHHAFAIASASRQLVSPESWTPLLSPLLVQADQEQSTTRVRDDSVPGAPSDIVAHRRLFAVNGSPIVVVVAEDMEALQKSQSELHAWTAVVSILLILLLIGSIWLGVTLALRPVASLQIALQRLRNREIARITGESPEEFQPLVQQLNQLLDSQDQRLERSREAIANLSHSIKTPITAIRQILEDSSRPLDHNLRREMASRLDNLDTQLESEIRRSRFAGPQIGKIAYPARQARDLLWMMGRLYPEKSFELSTALTEENHWPIEEQDLNEILGNLLDNAGKWSSHHVELCLQEDRDRMHIVVSDDGPGVAEMAREQLGTRGVRLDEQKPGHGLGLAIVIDVVQRYKGSAFFNEGLKGGLQVEIAILRPTTLAQQDTKPNRNDSAP